MEELDDLGYLLSCVDMERVGEFDMDISDITFSILALLGLLYEDKSISKNAIDMGITDRHMMYLAYEIRMIPWDMEALNDGWYDVLYKFCRYLMFPKRRSIGSILDEAEIIRQTKVN